MPVMYYRHASRPQGQLCDLSDILVDCLSAAVVRQTGQFATLQANVSSNGRSKEQKFLGTFCSFAPSLEQKFQSESSLRELSLPAILVPGSKSAEKRKVTNSRSIPSPRTSKH